MKNQTLTRFNRSGRLALCGVLAITLSSALAMSAVATSFPAQGHTHLGTNSDIAASLTAYKADPRSSKHAQEQPLSTFELETAVRAFEHLSHPRTPRAERIIQALLTQHSFSTLIDYGLLRYPHDCPPLYRRYCYYALGGDPGFLHGFRLDFEQHYEVAFEEREDWLAYVRNAVVEARVAGFALFTDEELEKARLLIFYERAKRQCEDQTSAGGEALTEAQVERACLDQGRRGALLDEHYCFVETASQWVHCSDPSLASISLPDPYVPPASAQPQEPSSVERDDTLSRMDIERQDLALALTCWVEQSAILGMPLSASDNGVSEFTISVDDVGIITLNGQAIETRYEGYTESGHLRFAAAAVPDIITGLSEQAAMGRAMPGVEQDDVDTIDQIQSFFTTLMLGGRDRVMFADVQNQEIIFGDVQGQILTNQSQATCS